MTNMQRLQILYSITQYTDFSQAFFQNVVLFNGTCLNVISFTPKQKVQSSLGQFSRNWKMLNSITCRAVILNFSPIEQQMWRVLTEIHLCRDIKCSFYNVSFTELTITYQYANEVSKPQVSQQHRKGFKGWQHEGWVIHVQSQSLVKSLCILLEEGSNPLTNCYTCTFS